MHLEPGSFRDRKSRVFYNDGAVYRTLSEEAFADWELLSESRLFAERVAEGTIVQTSAVGLEEVETPPGHWHSLLRHERIPFISYPYEWSFSMLRDAALLHLSLLNEAVDNGLILKDSTPFNIQWRGAQPVFVDIPSFERLPEGEPWIGYRQFCGMFLYPLLIQAYKNVPFHPWLRGRLSGMTPAECANLMSFWDKFRRGVLTHVVLHSKAEARYSSSNRDVRTELRSAGFSQELIKANAKRLAKTIEHLVWKSKTSQWSEYVTDNSYDEADRARKHEFVKEVAESKRWPLVWDIGANTGEYSRIVSTNADYVIAMDADPLAVDRLYNQLHEEGNRSILPLVVDITDPSPDLGWRGMERKSLEHRQKPDLVLALALVHHLTITHNVPLEDQIAWLASLDADVIVEFVAPEDPMAQRLLTNRRDDVHLGYDTMTFEKLLRASFKVEKSQELGTGTRTLYFARSHR